MAKKARAKTELGLSLNEIKLIAITGMFADDALLDCLVLKGGNALSLVHHLGVRASVDLDFSMARDWDEGLEKFCSRIEKALTKTFQQKGYVVFDTKMQEKPSGISEDMANFWGGYAVEFKLIRCELFEKYSGEIDELRKHAISLGQGKKFLIDVSRFEYVSGKQCVDLDNYRIYVYTPLMIVCEKLRAICQQMPKYGEVIRRTRPGTARARDFVDIYSIMKKYSLDMGASETRETLVNMFEVKKVPLPLLGKIEEFRNFHRGDFAAVRATVDSGTVLRDFDVYFDFVVDMVSKLKPLWNV